MSDRVSINTVEELRTRHEALAAEVAELRRAAASRRRLPLPRWSRRPATSVIVTIVLLLTAPLVLASDRFDDVPESSFSHEAAAAIADAGITAGCNAEGTLYCPNVDVTREQMAAFLHRGFGRVASAEGFVLPPADSEDVQVTSLTITSGGVAGETGFLLVTGSATLHTTAAGVCPCQIGVRPDVNGAQPSIWQFQTVPDIGDPFGLRIGSVSISTAFPVATNTTHTVSLMAVVETTTGTVTVQGNLTALYVPFGSTGASTLSLDAAPAAQDGLAD